MEDPGNRPSTEELAARFEAATLDARRRLRDRVAYYTRYLDACFDEGSEVGYDAGRAELGRRDLFYLLVYILGRKDMLHPWVFERCCEVQTQPYGFLDLWAREHFKDLADDTPMLTANRGWTTHGDLRVSDRVFAPDGQTARVIALSPKYTTSSCYQILFSDGASLIAGAGHLWRVRQKHRVRINGGRDVRWTEEIIPTCDLPNRADVGAVEAPLVGVPAQLPIDPYVLGVWLGDGTTGNSRVTAGHADADEMERLLRARGITVSRTSHSNAVSLRLGDGKRGYPASSEFTNALRTLGIYREKKIPEPYLRASSHQRMMLLRGLMDSDGNCNDRGTATFTNKNEYLALQMHELATGLALRPRFRRYEYPSTGLFWQISFQAHRDRNPFCLERKAAHAIASSAHRNCRDVVSIEPIASVPTRCIEVAGGMYLAGRELIPTHNSSISTFGHNIQTIINNPNITIGIFSHTRDIAKGFLKQIKQELEINVELKRLYPDVFWSDPQNQALSWSLDNGIIVKRSTNSKEATVEAWGVVDSQPTSKHFDVLDYDDLVTLDTVGTPEQIQKCITSWSTSLNLGRRGGQVKYLGSKYHAADPYTEIVKRGAAILRKHAVTEDGTATGRPVLLTRDELAKKRREFGPHTFACQLLLDPTAEDTQGFKLAWLRYWPCRDFHGLNKYLICDPANEKKKNSDYTVMVVWGLGGDGNYYICDFLRDRLNLPERTRALFALHRKWRPLKTGYEQYGKDSDIQHIESVQTTENYRFDITILGTNKGDKARGELRKEDRIRRMIPLLEQGRIFLPEGGLIHTTWDKRSVDMIRELVDEEYQHFPLAGHDDGLDAMSRILDPKLAAEAASQLPDDAAQRARTYAEQMYELYGGGAAASNSWMSA